MLSKFGWLDLFTLLAVFTLGALAGSIPEKKASARARQDNAVVAKEYNSTQATVQEIWNRVESVGCVDADTQLGMSAGTCAARMAPCSKGTVLSLICQDEGKTGVVVNFAFDGNWNP